MNIFKRFFHKKQATKTITLAELLERMRERNRLMQADNREVTPEVHAERVKMLKDVLNDLDILFEGLNNHK